MIGRSRPHGRHRDGQARTKVYRRLWDGPARAEAERLDQAWPDWTVLYSLGNRRFYAVAAWPDPQPVVVEDETAAGLEGRMHKAETARIALRTAPAASSGVSPSPDRRGGAVSLAPAVPQNPYPSSSRRRVA
ncbi:hypothetical protein AB0395_03870 [Streptosporangium sp. NPDC051023]|uniref:hypothetical protein n=1 Tax=Streptosporangium sp. NPDC051023 TaxID=3155410 RepID=UPI00344B3D8E